MSRIVLTTSSSGLDDMDILHNIELIRLRIYVNNIEFVDGRNINSERLQYLMNDFSHSPVHTSPAPAAEVATMLRNLYAKGIKEVFVTTLSSQVSESYNIISEVAKDFADKMDIYIYDTKDLNACEALLALEAAHLMRENKPMSEIASRLDLLRRSHSMLFVADDLSYLIKNKKIPGPAGFFANLFNIKPVLRVSDEGLVEPISKIRNVDKAFEYIINAFSKTLRCKNSFVYMLSAGRPDLDKRFLKLIEEKTGVRDILVLPVSAISLANHGPSGLGLCVFERDIPTAAKLFRA